MCEDMKKLGFYKSTKKLSKEQLKIVKYEMLNMITTEQFRAMQLLEQCYEIKTFVIYVDESDVEKIKEVFYAQGYKSI